MVHSDSLYKYFSVSGVDYNGQKMKKEKIVHHLILLGVVVNCGNIKSILESLKPKCIIIQMKYICNNIVMNIYDYSVWC